MFEGKAGADDKAQHTREYVSILKRPSTQPSGARWGFEIASIMNRETKGGTHLNLTIRGDLVHKMNTVKM